MFIVFLIFIFLGHKLGQIYPDSGPFRYLNILGLSFLALKVISFAILDLSGFDQGKSMPLFLGYCLYAPTFVSGPIFEFNHYRLQLSLSLSLSDRFDLFLKGVKRIILGIFKISVLSRFTSGFTFYAFRERTLLNCPTWQLMAFSYLTVIDLYFNFSGYTDIAIGTSSCLGISMVENFNYPFVARNLQDFWQRWHMSFTNWLKKYIFLPFSKYLLGTPFFAQRQSLVAPFAIFVTFTLMGVWHGLQPNYFLYGFFHGFGLFIVVLWSQFLKKRGVDQRCLKNVAIQVFSWFLTFNYFTLSLLIFYASTNRNCDLLIHVLRRVLHV